MVWWVDYEESEGLMAGCTLLGTEIEWEFSAGPDVTLYGTADLVYHNGEGIVVRDFKTGKSFRDLNANDFQLATYALAMSKMFDAPVVKAEYARIKQVMNPKTLAVDTTPTYVNDEYLRIHEEFVRRTGQQMYGVVQSMKSQGNPLNLPFNVTNDCGWKCDNQAACVAMSYGEDWQDVLAYSNGVTVEI